MPEAPRPAWCQADANATHACALCVGTQERLWLHPAREQLLALLDPQLPAAHLLEVLGHLCLLGLKGGAGSPSGSSFASFGNGGAWQGEPLCV